MKDTENLNKSGIEDRNVLQPGANIIRIQGFNKTDC